MRASPVAKTIWLHIGTEKTGTSTIQGLMARNHDNLTACGLLYPKFPTLGMVSHLGVVQFALGEEDRKLNKLGSKVAASEVDTYAETFIQKLGDEIAASGCSDVVLSSEHLSTKLRSSDSITQLVGSLRELAEQVRVIVYLRPQYELFPSLFSTQVKGGRTTPFKPPKRAKENSYNYDRMLRLWEQASGIDSIEVRLFQRQRFKNGNLIDDFFDVLGREKPDTLDIKKEFRNPRLNASSLEFLRMVNSLHARPTSELGPLRRGLIRELERVSDDANPAMPPETLAEIDALYRESNEKVAKRYFPDLTDPLFPAFSSNTDGGPALTLVKAIDIACQLWEASHTKAEGKPRNERRKLDGKPGTGKRKTG